MFQIENDELKMQLSERVSQVKDSVSCLHANALRGLIGDHAQSLCDLFDGCDNLPLVDFDEVVEYFNDELNLHHLW
jgi:hypothetical protein